ncbi:hypothetical protein [Streptomyces albireticuli]|uniref:hypothetical protein n=1 Tax=Streptomyces albireticuli TaxID=1940 RepID=UPI000D1B1AED|nr:hypothetical protein [Streptomyces albireticuli]MCD9141217.1 hypothetical protein [Streptomyces albireticuli]MCD9160822.1 hypothetical protein [Streptomyces albireticuli]MCD9191121.1 hypothetical protein [Streptomyces albireticuli]
MVVLVVIAALALGAVLFIRDGDGEERDGPGGRSPSAGPSPSFTFPGGLPSGLPTALPSGLPTRLPTKLPTKLPSGFPTSWPSGFPTELLPRLPDSKPVVTAGRAPDSGH